MSTQVALSALEKTGKDRVRAFFFVNLNHNDSV